LIIEDEAVTETAKEMRALIRSNLGKFATEEKIRQFFEDGGLDEWVDSGAVTNRQAERALDEAIDMYMEGY
jgi:hypothetical protein